MTAKRVSRSHDSPAERNAIRTTILTEQAVAKELETGSVAPIAGSGVNPNARRGFVAGHELEDWIAAETAVDRQLSANQAA